MEELIARWIRETRFEYEKAKLNQNVFNNTRTKLRPHFNRYEHMRPE